MMIKSKVIAIGNNFFSNPQKVTRIYEKMIGIKTSEVFKYSSATLMNSKKINNSNKEELEKFYKVFESAILKDECLDIFCFDTIEDFEKFDINGVLKEKAIIIDSISEEDYGMTTWELWTYCNKEYKIRNNGDYKVILVDTVSGKEYMIGEFEPRRTFVKETDKTVEFSIYPVKKEQIKEIAKISVSEFVQSKLDESKKNANWLANEMKISPSSIYGKLERDSFNAYDLLKISKIFNLSLEDILEKVDL